VLSAWSTPDSSTTVPGGSIIAWTLTRVKVRRAYLPANKSIVSPSLTETIAFFHERDSPLL